MQVTEISKNLSDAITYLEEILNKSDGKAFIESIKRYKKTKNPDDIKLH